jgi:hypothetical protein
MFKFKSIPCSSFLDGLKRGSLKTRKPKMGTWKVISWKVLNLGWKSKRILKAIFKIYLLKNK